MSRHLLLLAILSAALAIGCSSSQTATKTDATTPHIGKNISTAPPGILSDSLYLKATPEGLMETVVAGKDVPAEYRLSKRGDEVKFMMGKTIKLVVEGLDTRSQTVQSQIEEETGVVTLKVVDINMDIVTLEKKCQTIQRLNTRTLPEIRLADGIEPQQIVVTPICDDNKQVAGYQIRYGSEERGCRKEAQPALIAFNRCFNTPPPTSTTNAKKKGAKSEPAGKKRNALWSVLFYGD